MRRQGAWCRYVMAGSAIGVGEPYVPFDIVAKVMKLLRRSVLVLLSSRMVFGLPTSLSAIATQIGTLANRAEETRRFVF